MRLFCHHLFIQKTVNDFRQAQILPRNTHAVPQICMSCDVVECLQSGIFSRIDYGFFACSGGGGLKLFRYLEDARKQGQY